MYLLTFLNWNPMISVGQTECIKKYQQLTSFPALVRPLTVCSSIRLPLRFRYFTFLKDRRQTAGCSWWCINLLLSGTNCCGLNHNPHHHSFPANSHCTHSTFHIFNLLKSKTKFKKKKYHDLAAEPGCTVDWSHAIIFVSGYILHVLLLIMFYQKHRRYRTDVELYVFISYMYIIHTEHLSKLWVLIKLLKHTFFEFIT